MEVALNDTPSPLRAQIEFRSFRSVGDLQHLAELDAAQRHNASIMGPSDPKQRRVFFLSVGTLVVAGAANDFLGKTIYQILPGVDSGWEGLSNDHWITLCLACGAFTASSMAIFLGRESFKDLTLSSFIKMLLPSLMDFFVTVSRYLALVFLPAAMVTILKSGLQLVFLSIVRWCRGKHLGKFQWIGLLVMVIGLSVVSLHTFLENALTNTTYTVLDTVYGVSIMMFVGICGAIRNTFEEILLKDLKFNAFFIVGIESIVSLFLALVMGGIAFLITGISIGEASYAFTNTLRQHPAVIVCVCLFMTVVFTKDTMQMKVTFMSSAMTRKLFQQLYPLFTFTFSLVLYLITRKYGENWDPYTYVELMGFAVVLYGGYLYFIEPKYGLPEKVLTFFGVSDFGDKRKKTTDLIDKDTALLTSDFLQANGVDTSLRNYASPSQSSTSTDKNNTAHVEIALTTTTI